MLIDEHNSRNLLNLGINVTDLPTKLQSTIKEYIDVQKETGLYDLDSSNLEVWHLNKKIEAHTLEQDILKPLQRKVKNVNREIEKEEKKINVLNE